MKKLAIGAGAMLVLLVTAVSALAHHSTRIRRAACHHRHEESDPGRWACHWHEIYSGLDRPSSNSATSSLTSMRYLNRFMELSAVAVPTVSSRRCSVG